MADWIGWVGVAAFALAWVPQSFDTLRAGRCEANLGFLCLAALGSLALTAYAWLRGDAVFASLNALTGAGALLNLYLKLFPPRR